MNKTNNVAILILTGTAALTIAVGIGKEAFYKQAELPIEKAYKYTSEVMAQNMLKKDAKEGIEAFLEKREPKWEN